MLLVIDIGNTNITLGIFDGDNKVFTARLATDISKTGDQYAVELVNILNLNGVKVEDIDGCIVSSVVPVLIRAFKKTCSFIRPEKTLFVGPGVKTGLDIKIDNPAQLGADLAVGAVAALKKYQMP